MVNRQIISVLLLTLSLTQVSPALGQATGALQPVAPSVLAEPVNQGTVVVRRGQTLWRIAVQNSNQEVTVWQALMALHKANPKAFVNNQIHLVMAGATLVIPSQQAMQAMTSKQAEAAFYELIASYDVSKPGQQASAEALTTLVRQLQQVQQEQQVQAQQLLETAQRDSAIEAQLHTQKQALLALEANNRNVLDDLDGLHTDNLHSQGLLTQHGQQLEQISAQLASLEQPTTPAPAAAAVKPDTVTKVQEPTNASPSSSWYEWAIAALLVLLGGLLVGLFRRSNQPQRLPPADASVAPLSPPGQSMALDPLADHDGQSNQVGINQTAEGGQGERPLPGDVASESQFIEQLLRERQGQTKAAAQPQYDLAAEVDELLQPREAQADDYGYEPQVYTNAEDAVMEKLDLANSYIHMGEVAEAQRLLQEVLHEGNLEQRTEATMLLATLPQD